MSRTIGERLRSDSRVIEAKRLLLEALAEHRDMLSFNNCSDPDQRLRYDDHLERISRLRGRGLYFPYLSNGIGRGPLVELADGSVKYDFISGIGVHYFGHSHPMLVEAAIDAALNDTIMQGNLQQGQVTVDLLGKIIAQASQNGSLLRHCFLTTSGAMANENAFKIIFQKKAPASRLLAFECCFSGRSLATAQMTDKPANRVGQPKVLEIDYIPFYDEAHPDESIKRSVNCLQSLLEKNQGEYAGMCMELIQGEGGYYPGNHEFFMALIKVLKENNVALMIDEIQTLARTTHLFAFQYFALEPYVDVVTFGKMSQICGTIFSEEYNPKAGLLSQTFTGSTSAIYAARAIFDELNKGGYFGSHGKVTRNAQYFRQRLQGMADKNPQCISGPFGCGAMIAFTAFDGSLEKSQEFIKKLYAAGVLAFVAGKAPVRVRFLIPVGDVSECDIDDVSKIIEATLLTMDA